MISVFVIVVAVFNVFELVNSDSVCCSTPSLCYSNDGTLLPKPQCPENLGMILKLYTRNNPDVAQIITNTSIPSYFDGSKMSIYLLHGWTQNENFTWLSDVREKLLAQGDYNIIIVGWAKGAGDSLYLQSAANTVTAGAWIALVSNYTITNGGSARKRHYCIGASLGAHVCGYAGFYGEFGRISGLDPAGPFIDLSYPTFGLLPSHADFVDNIHTSAGVMGTAKVRGHTNFFPNGGSQQPGCPLEPAIPFIDGLPNILKDPQTTIETAQNISLLCDHIRAVKLFNESIATPCFKVRSQCLQAPGVTPPPCLFDVRSYQANPIQNMGFKADPYGKKGNFFLTTNALPPTFCKN